ncbi:MAG TPA: hypothetical protein DC054_13430 [Blastocatellia bacterium]|nr:hypothetical protein [Blastocatellia bacterium]
MEYKYDVFISYSSLDRPWALKLEAALKSKNIECFLDQRMDVGKPWDAQLATAVQSSKHLIALWSDNANASQWVRREVSYFETLNDPATAPQAEKDNRWYAFLMLEGQNVAYAGNQNVDAEKIRKAYDKNAPDIGAGTVDPGVWQDVVTKLAANIKNSDKVIRIPLAVLAMTQKDLEDVDPDKRPIWGVDLNTLLAILGIGNREALANSNTYGLERTDWRPFGQPLNVTQILDNQIDEINGEEQTRAIQKGMADPEFQFKWELIDQKFWTDDDVAQVEQLRLLSNWSALVIDPLSLYDDRVYEALVTLSECFNNDRCSIMVLTPFRLPQALVDLGTLIERRGRPFFNPYWRPPVPDSGKYANLGVNLGHEREVRRIIRRSLGAHIRQTFPQAAASFVRQ